jgi:catechol 2,3-dioxygenase-like lactoylglutathione lyase family enzyme
MVQHHGRCLACGRLTLSAPLAFRGGRDIALKVPPHQFDQTVAFYRDVLGLEHLKTHSRSAAFRFGNCSLWIDPSPHLSQAERWLELQADDTAAAAVHLLQHGVIRCDEVERLPEGFDGFLDRQLGRHRPSGRSSRRGSGHVTMGRRS